MASVRTPATGGSAARAPQTPALAAEVEALDRESLASLAAAYSAPHATGKGAPPATGKDPEWEAFKKKYKKSAEMQQLKGSCLPLIKTKLRGVAI